MRTVLLGCMVAIGAAIGFGGFNAALAAEVPSEFRGVWTIAVGAYGECRKHDWDGDRRTDAMMSVNAASIKHWESSCDIVSVKKPRKSTVSLVLACGGEGMRWRSKEVWYVQKIQSHKQLVTVSLGISDLREHSGKRVKNPTENKISVNINLECK